VGPEQASLSVGQPTNEKPTKRLLGRCPWRWRRALEGGRTQGQRLSTATTIRRKVSFLQVSAIAAPSMPILSGILNP
jgi:hypothetical protein